MPTISLKLGPLYSRLTEPADLQSLPIEKLPPDYVLRRHQALTWQAFNDPDVDVIFDTALTGDGKSLAGQLPMLTQNKLALLLYPTNEFITDQVGAVDRFIKAFGAKRKAATMYSQEITERMMETGFSRNEQIMSLIHGHDCVLSNPDLFHLMSSFNYGGSNQNKAEFVLRIPDDFQYFVFDEFHIFGQPQAISVLNILNYHKINSKRKHKYIFLSATPTKTFMKMLENSGFVVRKIDGDYSPVPAAGYTNQPIVQPVTLNIHSLTERGAYSWAENHLDELIDFYRTNPTAKGVFIVNSVATAKRLTQFYKQKLEETGIVKVGENTGLTNKEERKKAMEQAGLIIATSTVDVGVDFDINLLIFESYNAGTFVQRLGRLGRHFKPNWQEFRAYALLPDWIAEKFAARFPSDGSEINRLDFLAEVRGRDTATVGEDEIADRGPIFQPEQEFKHYASIWGGLQTAHIIASAESYQIGHQAETESARLLRQQYSRAYGCKDDNTKWIDKKVNQYKAKADTTNSKDKTDKLILEELNSFRGRSPLTCGIVDETDGFIKTYDLFFLLAYTDCRPITEAEFRNELAKRGLAEKFPQYQSRDLKLYLRLKNYLSEREDFKVRTIRNFKGKFNQVGAYNAFTITNSPNLARHQTDDVNEALSQLDLLILVSDQKPKEFKLHSGLGLLFPVYTLQDGTGTDRSLILGTDALLAYSRVFWRATKDDDCPALIF